jgi:hypothetical protein
VYVLSDSANTYRMIVCLDFFSAMLVECVHATRLWYASTRQFYQKIWPVIKDDLLTIFSQLQTGDLPLYKLNFGVITVLPKKRSRR